MILINTEKWRFEQTRMKVSFSNLERIASCIFWLDNMFENLEIQSTVLHFSESIKFETFLKTFEKMRNQITYKSEKYFYEGESESCVY